MLFKEHIWSLDDDYNVIKLGKKQHLLMFQTVSVLSCSVLVYKYDIRKQTNSTTQFLYFPSKYISFDSTRVWSTVVNSWSQEPTNQPSISSICEVFD